VTIIRELVSVDGLTRIHGVGFSIGGNIALRVAARTPDDIAPHLASVAVVSPSLDIDRAVSNVGRGIINLVYRQSFLRHLRGLVREKAKQFPGRFGQNILRGIRRIREFDNRITAHSSGGVRPRRWGGETWTATGRRAACWCSCPTDSASAGPIAYFDGWELGVMTVPIS
jgi:predicted alpha/beta-fold hydrolase